MVPSTLCAAPYQRVYVDEPSSIRYPEYLVDRFLSQLDLDALAQFRKEGVSATMGEGFPRYRQRILGMDGEGRGRGGGKRGGGREGGVTPTPGRGRDDTMSCEITQDAQIYKKHWQIQVRDQLSFTFNRNIRNALTDYE